MVVWKKSAWQSRTAQKLGAQFDFNVIGIPPVTVNGELVSSTTIRRAVESGDLQRRQQCLAENIRF
jgi:FAD synthase